MAEQSLFGTTPEALQASRDAALRQQASQYAQLDPFQRASMNLYQGGNRLGGAIGGLLGAQDPELQRSSMLKKLATEFDTTTAEGLTGFARAAAQAGMPQQAMQAAQQAQEMNKQAQAIKLQEAQLGKVEEETTRLKAANLKEDNLSTELSNLPVNATDADVEAVVRKYGKPEAVLSSLTRKQTAQAAIEAKATLAAERATQQEAEKARDREFKLLLATLASQQKAATTDLQRQFLQGKIDDLQAKRDDKALKAETAKSVAIQHASKVITDVDEALPMVGNLTTGLIGKASSVIPGTDAFTLNQRVSTIKANLGFDRLQQMRDASPTGGALGQVAVQELVALQNSVASLEVGQSKSELQKNLGKIKTHYSNWLAATQGTAPPVVPTAPAAAPATSGAWSITPKK